VTFKKYFQGKFNLLKHANELILFSHINADNKYARLSERDFLIAHVLPRMPIHKSHND